MSAEPWVCDVCSIPLNELTDAFDPALDGGTCPLARLENILGKVEDEELDWDWSEEPVFCPDCGDGTEGFRELGGLCEWHSRQEAGAVGMYLDDLMFG